jgi:thymidylate synthase (FAD)
MAHCIRKEAEDVLDKEYKVLDKGFVRLVDYMGSDERIVQAARVSYGAGTKTFRQDKGLIHYLLRNEHTSPFEQVVFTFHVRLPIFVARQWIRHRTARVNEISGRYSVLEPAFYEPSRDDVALQSSDNKQGRDDGAEITAEEKQRILTILRQGHQRAYEDYTAMLEGDIARELARITLPLSIYTEWYWQIDLHNLMHFLKLRLDPHAQKEIRAYASVIRTIAQRVVPVAMDAFDAHILHAVRLSAPEKEALAGALRGETISMDEKPYRRLCDKLGLSPEHLPRRAGEEHT